MPTSCSLTMRGCESLADDASLRHEALAPGVIVQACLQSLDGHNSADEGVSRFEDSATRPHADRFENFVASKLHADVLSCLRE